MHTLLAAAWLCGSAAALAQDAPDDDSSANPDEPPPPPPPPAGPDPTGPDAADILLDVDAFLAETPADGAATPAAPSAGAAAPIGANAFNPSLTAFGDMLLVAGFDDAGVAPGSGPFLRSFEMDIRAVVDPFAKAVAVFAVEQEPPPLNGGSDEEPRFSASPEEVYVDLVTLPAHLSARVGQFKLPFGLTNRMHPHDWPWPDAPPSFAAALGEEGMAEAGAMVQYQVHNRWNKALTLTAAGTAGDAFDPQHLSAAPGWLGRAEYFDDFGAIEVGLGANSVGWTDQRVDGADLMLRWRADSWHSVVLMGELYRPVDGGEAAPLGWNGTLQVQPTRPLYLGLRVDELDEAWQYAAFISYYTSEFLRVRAGASTDGESVLATGQLTFVWGSHPVEPYWVNR